MEEPGLKFVLGKPLRGWLRRQGGVLGGWHRRFFELREGCLYSYTKEDETRRNHTYNLKDYQLREVPASADEVDKFAFELISEKGNGESLMLCASTVEDKREWMKALNYHIYADRGGAIFGLPLEETMKYEQKQGRNVPYIVDACVRYLDNHGMETEGIFRLAGRAGLLKELRAKYETGQRPNLDSVDVHTVASLLKAYLRDLPESLIPPCLYQRAMNIAMRYSEATTDEARATELDGLSKLLEELPEANFFTLAYICQFLHRLAAKSELTKMDAHNLSVVFGPNLIRHIDNNPQLFMLTADLTHHLAYMLIHHCPEVLPHRLSQETNTTFDSTVLRKEKNTSTIERKKSDDLLESVLADLKDIDFTCRPAVSSVSFSNLNASSQSLSRESSDITSGENRGARGGVNTCSTSTSHLSLKPVAPKRTKSKKMQNRHSVCYTPDRPSGLKSQSVCSAVCTSDGSVADISQSEHEISHTLEAASMDDSQENAVRRSFNVIHPQISDSRLADADTSVVKSLYKDEVHSGNLFLHENAHSSDDYLIPVLTDGDFVTTSEKLGPSQRLLVAQVTALKEELAKLKSQSDRHILALREQLTAMHSKYEARITSMEKQHKSQIKNLEGKLAAETKARSDAVKRTISLQVELNKYQLQYGEL